MQSLLLLEEQEGSVNFKFGVLYAKAGQGSDDEMFSNGIHKIELIPPAFPNNYLFNLKKKKKNKSAAAKSLNGS